MLLINVTVIETHVAQVKVFHSSSKTGTFSEKQFKHLDDVNELIHQRVLIVSAANLFFPALIMSQ